VGQVVKLPQPDDWKNLLEVFLFERWEAQSFKEWKSILKFLTQKVRKKKA